MLMAESNITFFAVISINKKKYEKVGSEKSNNAGTFMLDSLSIFSFSW